MTVTGAAALGNEKSEGSDMPMTDHSDAALTSHFPHFSHSSEGPECSEGCDWELASSVSCSWCSEGEAPALEAEAKGCCPGLETGESESVWGASKDGGSKEGAGKLQDAEMEVREEGDTELRHFLMTTSSRPSIMASFTLPLRLWVSGSAQPGTEAGTGLEGQDQGQGTVYYELSPRNSEDVSGEPLTASSADTDQIPSSCWMEAAAPVVARTMPMAALKFMLRRRGINALMSELAEDIRTGFWLLAEVLGDSDETFSAVLAVARRLSSASIRPGDGLADFTAGAARLPWAERLVLSKAICSCCPKLLINFLPPVFEVPLAATNLALSMLPRAPFRDAKLCTGRRRDGVCGLLQRRAVLCRTIKRQALCHASGMAPMARE